MRTLQLGSDEAVIGFEPWITDGPVLEKDSSRWYCHLTVSGQRLYRYGSPCGTCGVVFSNVTPPAARVSDPEAVELLGSLETVPPLSQLQRLARVLPSGEYYAGVLEDLIYRVEPGSPADFFVTDVPRLFDSASLELNEPSGPDIPYYRFERQYELDRRGRLSGRHKALVTSLVMPLHSLESLDRERVEYWKQQIRAGAGATGFAVSMVDNQAPAMEQADSTYPYEEHLVLVNCLIDGHHRVQAAVELGASVRLLIFVTTEYSLVRDRKEFAAVLKPLLRSMT